MDNEQGGGQDAAAHRLLIGALINASPCGREKVLELLQPGDLDTPLAADALEIIRTLVADGVIGHGRLVEEFAATVKARQRDYRGPVDPLPVRYPVGPLSWIANAFTGAASLGEHGAVVLALQYSGSGRRRLIARAAGQLAEAARGEADDEDIAILAGKLLPLLGAAS